MTWADFWAYTLAIDVGLVVVGLSVYETYRTGEAWFIGGTMVAAFIVGGGMNGWDELKRRRKRRHERQMQCEICGSRLEGDSQ